MTPEDKLACSIAMARLSVATRDRTDQGVFDVYLSNPALDVFSVDDVIVTCARLETSSEWFPKLSELIKACEVTQRARIATAQQAYVASLPPLPMPVASPERVAEFKATIQALARSRRMS